MTAKKTILTGRKDLTERRDAARRAFQLAIKGIANGLDLHLSSGKLGPRGEELYQRVQVMLNKRAPRFILTVERLSELEDQRTLFTESVLFIAFAIAAAHQSGKSQGIQQLWRAISTRQKQKTMKAKRRVSQATTPKGCKIKYNYRVCEGTFGEESVKTKN